ncbi:NADPH-dependent F420 reductase [Hymenobacter sp. YC55]|uniref:NADPH-dependent F420 reductase n=1 Tax=Hymenobacter sp. YC55 TaxID=3034019 RepID=UPI0023F64165|nr:NADPH-dependent F420 reductase [Hymenobacter sp. YC55]MDF7815886.1 NADPH-dependent F420 reductase [Hymenobacter sp. YC55]
MKIGTIGAGRIAQAFIKHVAKAGFEVVVSNRTGPESLTELTQSFGSTVTAGTVEQAAQADLVLLTVPWTEVEDVLRRIPSWRGQIILDTTNAASFPDFQPLDLGGKTSTQLVAERAPGARVVKAFNTLFAATLAADPAEGNGKRVVFISGDDATAKTEVLHLLGTLGFAGIDLGDLVTGAALQQVGGPLIGKNLLQLA